METRTLQDAQKPATTTNNAASNAKCAHEASKSEKWRLKGKGVFGIFDPLAQLAPLRRYNMVLQL